MLYPAELQVHIKIFNSFTTYFRSEILVVFTQFIEDTQINFLKIVYQNVYQNRFFDFFKSLHPFIYKAYSDLQGWIVQHLRRALRYTITPREHITKISNYA